MSEWTYIGMAYGAAWVVLATYIVHVRRRLRRAELAAREAGVAGVEGRAQ